MPAIRVPATLESIPQAMEFLHKELGQHAGDIMTHVDLAVEEILVNIASYAYAEEVYRKGPNVDILEIACRWVNMDDQQLFCVRLSDWGAPFDPFQEVAKPDTDLSVEDRDFGGLGVHIVKHVSKHYMYSDEDGRNTVELYFQVKS